MWRNLQNERLSRRANSSTDGRSITGEIAVADLNGSHAGNLAQTLGEAGDRLRAANLHPKRHDALGRRSPIGRLGTQNVLAEPARGADLLGRIPLDLHAADRELATGATRKHLAKDAAAVLIGNLQRRGAQRDFGSRRSMAGNARTTTTK